MADVEITFGANIEALTKSIEGARSAIEELSSPISGVVSAFKELGEAVLAAFAFEQISEFVEHFAEMGEQIERTSAILGVSNKNAQEFGFIAQETGTSTEQMTLAMERLQVNLQSAQNPTSRQALALQALGLSAKELIGIPIDEQMNKIADSVARFSDGGNKTAIVMTLLGRTGAQMIPVLDEGGKGLEDLRQKAADASAVISDETVESLSALSHSITTAKAALTALGENIVGELSTAFQGFLKILTDLVASMSRSIEEGGALKDAFDVLSVAIQAVDIGLAVAIATMETLWSTGKAALLALANDFRDLGGVMYGAMTFNMDQIKSSWAAMLASNKSVAVTWANDVSSVMKNMTAEIKAALGSATGEEGEGAKKPSAPALAIPDTEGAKAAMQAAQDAIKAADLAYQNEVEKIRSSATLHQITEDQKTQLTIAAVNRREDAEISALNTAEQAASLSVSQRQKIEDEKTQIIQKAVNQRQQIQDQGMQADVQSWENALKPIQSAWDSQLKGLLSGTETWSQAMKNITADLVLDVIKELEKIAIEKAAIGLVNLFSGGAGSIFSGVAGLFGGGGGGAASSIGSFAVGGQVLSSGLAYIHTGETITPANVATPYNGGNGGGGGDGNGGGAGGGDMHFHFEGGVIGNQAWINQMMPQLARALSGYRNLNPSTA